jgi:hypothetical protein
MQILKSLGLAALGASAPAVLAGPVLRRGTVGNDDIVGLSETVPDTTAGTLYLKYKPFLYRGNGCVPYPAVDADGNTKYVSHIHNHLTRPLLFACPRIIYLYHMMHTHRLLMF